MSDYSITTEVIGAKELAEALNSIDGYAKSQIEKAINKTAYDIHNAAFLKAPHKTGNLRDSIHVDQDPGHLAQVSGDNITAVVGTNVVYARAQEYGTIGMTIHGRSKLGKSFTYAGKIKPKFYMRDASDGQKQGYITNMKTALQNIINHLAQSTKI